MSPLPNNASTLDLLRWVANHPNEPFDANMVVASTHTSDWQWQAVVGQMEDLARQNYIYKMKQDPAGSTYWTITNSGERYLNVLSSFEKAQDIERLYPEPSENAAGDTLMTVVGCWEQLKALGEGGQSKVFLVRSPARVQARKEIVQAVLRTNPWAPYAGGNEKELVEKVDRLALSIMEYARPDDVSELGALKVFKIGEGDAETKEALGRLNNEVNVLRQNRPGLVKLLAADEKERWIVTAYMPHGTLDRQPALYKGDALRALRAFRSLVETVAALHKDGYVHRDIKPANVFVTEHDRLVLGDFGIVFIPEHRERLTVTNERVGPRDYMPQWADIRERLEKVHTNFDVYMLGKLLWCMVTGRLKLPREYHSRPAYDVKALFPNDPSMILVAAIIDKCVVEEPDQCLSSAAELLALVDEQLTVVERGGQLLANGEPRHCRMCGKGRYNKVKLDPNVAGTSVVNLTMAGKPIQVSMFVCDQCYHAEFFRTA